MENFNEHGKSNRLNFLKLKIIWAFFSILCLFFTKQLSAQFPTDFQKIDLLTGLSNSTNFSFAPDGRIFILDRYGEVLIYKQNTQSAVSAGVLSVFHELEDGLIGIAFDPNFSTNDFVYLHYSPLSASVNRISRFKMNGDILDLSSEITIIEFATMRSAGINHSGGDMAFDSQGNLLIAVGDNSIHSNYAAMNETNQAFSAEKSSSNANDLRGKILRITPQVNGSYTIPSGNLFPNGTGGLPEIYVMGARNPYRIFIDKEHNDWLFKTLSTETPKYKQNFKIYTW
jgi:glucose/arabinose dehydrogenase